MTPTRYLSVALALAIGTLALAPARAQDEDPFQALRQYDSQSRKPVEDIAKRIRAAGHDKALLAEIETAVLEVLKDPNASFPGKQEATRFLWEIGTARSVSVLAKMLPDPKTNDIARYALERNAAPSAAAALRAALATTRGTALVGVINSIGNRGDAQAVPALKKLSVNADPLVADAAITALGKVGTSAALAALKAIPSKGIAVYTAMLQTAEKLSSSNKQAGLGLYEQLTGKAYPPVIRAAAIQALARLNSPKAGSLALSVAQTATEPDLQREAARVAGSLAAPADTKRAASAWAKLPPGAQVALLTAWADRKEPASVPVALSALKSESQDVRRAAIQTAAVVGGPRAIAVLVPMTASGEDQQPARDALARMRGPGVEQALLQAAGQGEPSVRAVLMAVLAERATPAATTTLVTAARGTETRVAVAALRSLGRTARADQQASLTEVMVRTGNDEVRDAAREALVAVSQRAGNGTAVADSLASSVTGATPQAQAALLLALAEVGGDRALEALSNATESQNPDIKNAAVSALADTWSNARALPTLLKIAQSDAGKSYRVQALRGYLRIAGADERAPTETRLNRVREALSVAERPEEKRQALSVLRDVRSPAAVELAAQSLDDPELVAEAADAVIYLASPQRRNNRDIPAVKGAATDAALDKVIRSVKDDTVRAHAQRLRSG
jgi:HEAT repeat protein